MRWIRVGMPGTVPLALSRVGTGRELRYWSAVAIPDTAPPIVHAVNRKVIRPLTDFLHKEASAGLLLVAAAVVALIWANSPWSDSYFELWNTEAMIRLGDFEIDLNLREWINDAAMVLFFLVAGLEIKRELTQGELRDPKQAALPIIAAVGGMIVPAVIYTILNSGGEGQDGWGIPMATDIAIVMGVVALLGTRAPSWLKLFLLALAIVDDIGAILVIAVFYSEGVSFGWLAIAIGAVAVAATIRTSTTWVGAYVLLGTICWLGLHQANVHPTLAGVAFGMLAPVTPFRDSDMVDADDLARNPTGANAHRIALQARSTVSVVEWLEHRLHPYSAFLVVPVFALANAGIRVPANELGDALSNRVTWGVILGLVIGKTIGITVFTLGAVALRVGRLPRGVTPRYVIGAGALGGIGFTVSLFVTELAFGEELVGTDARLGVLIASLAAALIGTMILVPGHVIHDRSMDDAYGPDADIVAAGSRADHTHSGAPL
jgi:NhaA family Na+:H+ antiporter